MCIVLLSNTLTEEEKAMRDVYCDTLLDIAEKDDRLLLLDADLMAALGVSRFAKKYPEKTINCGIQEANMFGVAAGSFSKRVKYRSRITFATFATRRACDQIFMSGAYAGLNVKVVGSDPGVTAALNGGTHMPFEDIGIMRTIPTMTIIEPTDSTMLEFVIREAMDTYGMFYIRLSRKKMIKVFEKGSKFSLDKAILLRQGTDVNIIASGILVAEALKAAEELEKHGISAQVVNVFVIKPIDKQMIIECSGKTGAVVTAENHNIMNALGSAVAEVLAENIPVPMERVGVNDEFGEVGDVESLKIRFGLTADNIVAKAKKSCGKKAGLIEWNIFLQRRPMVYALLL